MSSPPTKFVPGYDFVAFQTAQPASPLPAINLVNDLNALKQTTDQTIDRLAEVQRADGRLANRSVHADALDTGALALFSKDLIPRGDWATATVYAVRDLVTVSGAVYICRVAHTSAAAFATDEAASRWMLFANPVAASGAAFFQQFNGTGAQTVFTLSANQGTSATNIYAFVGSRPMRPDIDFTLNGTTLTFTAAPVSGTNNVLVFGAANLISSALVEASAAAASATASAATATTQAGLANTARIAAELAEANAEAAEVNAAASALAAQAAVDSVMWQDVVFLTSADSPYTVVAGDRGKLFSIDCASGAVTINLPTIAGLTLTEPFVVGFKKSDSTTNAVTINRASTDTIDGATSKVLTSQGFGTTLTPDTTPAPDMWVAADFGSMVGSVTVDPFTGDGSTTAFVLSSAPGSATATLVAVSGIVQRPGTDYSVSGTTLTMVTAPPNGVPVIARYGTTVSIGTPADGTVTAAKIAAQAVTPAKIDPNGTFLFGGTNSAGVAGNHPIVQGHGIIGFGAFRWNAGTGGGNIALGHSRSNTQGTQTALTTNDALGSIVFYGSDGTSFVNNSAIIRAEVAAAVSTGIVPTRFVFETMGITGAVSQVMALDNEGWASFNHNAAASSAMRVTANHASFTGNVLQPWAVKSGATDFDLIEAISDNGSDVEFRVRGDGQATTDGSFTGGGADYAEFFEWADGNPTNEDRVGYSVVLDGNKIRKALPGDSAASIIGVISGNPSVVGDAAWNKWSGKHVRDDFGRYLWEDYQTVTWIVEIQVPATEEIEAHVRREQRSYPVDALPEGVTPPEDATYSTAQRRVVSPSYDPNAPYTPREQRPEWGCVGLMGKLRLRVGQPVGDRWIKMRDVSETVEEWLVR